MGPKAERCVPGVYTWFLLHETFVCIDDDNNGVLTLQVAHFPEILPVITKQAATKMHLDGRKQTSAKCTAVPGRKGNGTNELWYTIPYHFATK